MRIQAEPSKILTNLNGVTCRVWNGVTEDGEQIFLYVARVAIPDESRTELIEKLIEVGD